MTGDQSATRTAGIIIIGNEILSGKVQDLNSFFLACGLRELGVSVMRISVIPDDVDTIGREAALFSKSYDYVFTSGGVGPTHDDVTMEGIAKGFGVRLVRHPELEGRFRLRYGESAHGAILKMAEVPEGTEIIDLGDMRFPVVSFRNIFIFPGIPEYLREKFSSIKERFRCASFFLKKFFLNAEETEIAAMLNALVKDNGDVAFGSYPVLENPEYKIVVTLESKSEESIKKAVKDFLSKMPAETVVKIV
jgi:molybdenum cofactor synthesis domain-containing protein